MADDLRSRLLEMGIEVFDTREGPVWRKTVDLLSDK
jgi:cysteinyl-tRNA synthetase